MIRSILAAQILLAGGVLAADPALLEMLPPASTTVVGIDVEKSRNSPFGQYMLAKMKQDDKGLARFITLTGFDPRRDLQEIIAASPAGRKNGLFVARGIFDPARLLAAAKDSGAQTAVYQGVNVIEGKDAKDDNWIALVDGARIVGGTASEVRAALDRRKSPQAALDAATLATITDLSARYDAWAYALAPQSGIALPGTNQAQQKQIFGAIQKASAGMRFGVNVEIEAEALARSDKDAVALQDVIRFLTSMIQLNRDKNPQAGELAAVLESLQVKTSANMLSVSLKIPQTELERLIESGNKAPRKRAAI